MTITFAVRACAGIICVFAITNASVSNLAKAIVQKPPMAPPPQTIPGWSLEGATAVGGTRLAYYCSDNWITWSLAKTVCESIGWHLADLHTDDLWNAAQTLNADVATCNGYGNSFTHENL
jgi:hypothetical protein